jgi:hypothetical protein
MEKIENENLKTTERENEIQTFVVGTLLISAISLGHDKMSHIQIEDHQGPAWHSQTSSIHCHKPHNKSGTSF